MGKIFLIGVNTIAVGEHVARFIARQKELGKEVIFIKSIEDVPDEFKLENNENVFVDDANTLDHLNSTQFLIENMRTDYDYDFKRYEFMTDDHMRIKNRKKKWESPNKFHR
jgi:superfamily I DNA and/or RNA helicase